MRAHTSKENFTLGGAMERVTFPDLLLLFALTFGMLISLNGCFSSSPPQVVTLDASWAEYYNSLKDLKQHSDIAVNGTISSIAPAFKPADGPVYSMVTITIHKVLWKRSPATSPSTITFEQTGGTYNNVTYQITDDPLFHVKDQAILFFKEYSPGKYRVSGGPSGRFSIKNGIVHPIVSDGVKLTNATDASHFATALQSA